MKISTNSFSKKTVPTSSNQFSRKTLATGTAFAKKELAEGSHAYEGENLSGGDPALDFLESGGVAPDLGVAGGISHFKNRMKVTPIH